jgi:hypothetical protein
MFKKANRKSVELLFRDLIIEYEGSKREEAIRLQKQLDELQEKLLAAPEFKALQRKADKAWDGYRKAKMELEGEIRKVRQKYVTEGLTEEVLAGINNLIKLAKE